MRFCRLYPPIPKIGMVKPATRARGWLMGWSIGPCRPGAGRGKVWPMNFDAWLWSLPVLAAAAVFPGPNNLLCLSNGMAAGTRAAFVAVGGRIIGFAILIAITIAGLGAVLAQSAVAFDIIRWCGVLYLGWIAVQCWRGADTPLAFASSDDTAVRRMARRELLLVLTNPKAILIVTALLPQFVDPARSAVPQLLIVGGSFLVIEWIMAIVYAGGGGRLARIGLSARATRWMNRGFAGLFAAAAVGLAVSRK